MRPATLSTDGQVGGASWPRSRLHEDVGHHAAILVFENMTVIHEPSGDAIAEQRQMSVTWPGVPLLANGTLIVSRTRSMSDLLPLVDVTRKSVW